MFTIAQLLHYYEIVNNHIERDPGTIFNYRPEEDRGLMVFAEIVARSRTRGVVSLYIPTSATAGLYITPNTFLRYGFRIERKLDKIYKEGHYLLCLQFESELESGNFLVLKTDERCENLTVFAVSGNQPTPIAVTTMLFDFDEGISEDLVKLYKVCESELSLMSPKPRTSMFGALS